MAKDCSNVLRAVEPDQGWWRDCSGVFAGLRRWKVVPLTRWCVREGRRSACLWPPKLSDAMERFLIDSSLRDRLSANALRRAHLFSWRECAEQTLEIYRRVVSMRAE